MTFLSTISDSSMTQNSAKSVATAGLFGLYLQQVLGIDPFTETNMRYLAVVGGSSLASGLIWDQIDSGRFERQNIAWNLTAESAMEAASTAAISYPVYQYMFGIAPSQMSLAYIAGADLAGQVAGPYIARFATGQAV